jgi:hypothetical protein
MRHDLHLHKGAFKVSYSFWTLKVTVSRRSKALACKLSNNTTEPPQPTYHVPLPSKQRAVTISLGLFSERFIASPAGQFAKNWMIKIWVPKYIRQDT